MNRRTTPGLWKGLNIPDKSRPPKVAFLTTRYRHKDSKSLKPKIVLVWQARFVVLPGLIHSGFLSGFRGAEVGILARSKTH